MIYGLSVATYCSCIRLVDARLQICLNACKLQLASTQMISIAESAKAKVT